MNLILFIDSAQGPGCRPLFGGRGPCGSVHREERGRYWPILCHPPILLARHKLQGETDRKGHYSVVYMIE